MMENIDPLQDSRNMWPNGPAMDEHQSMAKKKKKKTQICCKRRTHLSNPTVWKHRFHKRCHHQSMRRRRSHPHVLVSRRDEEQCRFPQTELVVEVDFWTTRPATDSYKTKKIVTGSSLVPERIEDAPILKSVKVLWEKWIENLGEDRIYIIHILRGCMYPFLWNRLFVQYGSLVPIKYGFPCKVWFTMYITLMVIRVRV